MDFPKNNKAIYEIASVAIATSFFGLLGLRFATLFYLVALLLPLPLAYLIIRRHLFHGLWALGLTMVLLVLATNSLQTMLLMVLQFGPVGIFIGLLLKNNVAVDKSMAVLFFWALVMGGLNMLFIFIISGIGTSGVVAEFYSIMESTSDLYLQKGILDEAGKQQFLETARSIGYLVQELIPASMAIWAIIVTIFTYFITRHLVRRMGHEFSGDFKFVQWQLPWYSIWLVIIGLAMVMAGEEFSLSLVRVIGTNILFIAAFIFFVLGLAVITYLLRRWNINRFFKIIIVVAMVVYFPFSVILLLSLGVADPVANLRRLPRDNGDEAKGGKD